MSGQATIDTSLTNDPSAGACRHCGLAVPIDRQHSPFCCSGCEAAYALVSNLGLDSYYRRRTLDPALRNLKPEDAPGEIDVSSYVRDAGDGTLNVSLMIDGLHCAACVWLIESVLMRQKGVVAARVNMTTRRLRLSWRAGDADPSVLLAAVTRLGYRVIPFDPEHMKSSSAKQDRALLRALSVAGFAFGNVMLLSVAVWAGHAEGMGPATRSLLHWISALIALPAIVFSGQTFFRSAIAVVRQGRTNMDVPISIGVILAAAMSLHETIVGAQHVYFDSSIGLLFFLLIGRVLDRRMRRQAQSSAEHVLALTATAAKVMQPDGAVRLVPTSDIQPGMRILVAAGERIPADGRVTEGTSTIDTSLIDGESAPKTVIQDSEVFAGTLNLSGTLIIEASVVSDHTLLAEIARLIEAAECQRGRYVALADRVARYYAPVVHGAAALTFLGWWLVADLSWQQALLIAIAVLIITCPCALALAVPAVQVIATGRLLRRGIIVKSGTALERLAEAEMVVFDKTGTLTTADIVLDPDQPVEDVDLSLAAAMAAASTHPLARAVVRAASLRGIDPAVASNVREVSGSGLESDTPDGVIRLGSRSFCGLADSDDHDAGPELWLDQPPLRPVRLSFIDQPRADAKTVVGQLIRQGYQLAVFSGDRKQTVGRLARMVGIQDWRSGLSPVDKVQHLNALHQHGRHVLMVGDGLNDAPALASAHVSMSPATAADVSQNAADVVFQGDRLAPVVYALQLARRADTLVRQNLMLAFGYNAVTIPLAAAGYVTPLVAAIAMSTSSLAVMLNALRLSRGSL